jgi:D-threo-aldose 1-dehydrogenase
MLSRLSTRPLGNTPLKVSKLGFGGGLLGNLYESLADDTAQEAMTQAVKSGIAYFDTAPFYGFGLSEQRVGQFLQKHPSDELILSTKVGRRLVPIERTKAVGVRHGFCSPMPFEPVFDYSYDGVMRSYEDSLQRLGRGVDVLLMHDLGEFTHGQAHERVFKQAMEGGYRAMDELRRSGEISAIGLGVNEWQVCEQAMGEGDFDCFLLAGRYTLLEQQSLERFLPECLRRGCSVIMGGPYNSGILAVGTQSNSPLYYNYEPASAELIKTVKRFEAVCESYQIPLAAAALQFPLAHPAVASVVPGLNCAAQVIQTIALFNTRIPDSFWTDLKHENLIQANAPIPTRKIQSTDTELNIV